MPRDIQRYTYVTLGLAKDTTLFNHLQAEAARMELHLSVYIKQLLKDRDNALYEDGPLKGYWFPRGFVLPSSSGENMTEKASLSLGEPTEAAMLANAQGAISAWSDDE